MRRKRVSSILLSAILSVSMAFSPIAGMPVFAAEEAAEAATTEEPANEEEIVEEVTEDSTESSDEVSEEQDAETIDTSDTEEVEDEEPDQKDASADIEETAEDRESIQNEETSPAEDENSVADTSDDAALEEEEEIVNEAAEDVEGKEAAMADEGDAVASGTCGDNATWTLTETDDGRILTIDGKGPMYDSSISLDRYINTYVPSWLPQVAEATKITTVIVKNGITSIGDYAFYNMTSLVNVSLPESLTSIGYEAFYGCRSLESISIPDSVTSIESGAFENCSSLKNVKLSNSVTSLEGVFRGCSSLKDIAIPDSVTNIDHAFRGCSSLENITIPDGVKSIYGTFVECYHLQNVVIPDSVTNITYAFVKCYSLQSVDIPENVTIIGDYAFNECKNLQSVVIPEGVTSIGVRAFGECKMKSVAIPDSVTSIGAEAFIGCGLDQITIPDSLSSIGGRAFCGNDNIYFKGDAPVFDGIDHVSGLLIGGAYERKAYYPVDNPTWTKSARDEIREKIIGMGVTWEPWDPSVKDFELTVYAYGENALGIALSKVLSQLFNKKIADEGHTWLSITNKSSTTFDFRGKRIGPSDSITIGLWPDSSNCTSGYGGVFVNMENWAYRGQNSLKHLAYYSIPVSRRDIDRIEAAVPLESYYHDSLHDDTMHNCSTFAVKMWNLVADKDEEFNENLIDVPAEYELQINGKNKEKYGETRFLWFLGHSSKYDVFHIDKNGNLIKIDPSIEQKIKTELTKTSVPVGETASLSATETVGDISYKSSNEKIATVSAKGIIKGKSVGKVEITVTAASTDFSKSVSKTVTVNIIKGANKITASNRTLNYSAKAQSINLNAKASGGKITYKSNNSKVKVTSTGKVTIPAKFTGVVKITITAAGNSNYKKGTKTITITVPTKTTLSSVSNSASKKMKVTWKKNTSVTGYQIQYSLKSSFASPKTVTISKNSQIATTISNLMKGKKYYVRIRSYKTVSGKKYYSAWSAAKATTIKK